MGDYQEFLRKLRAVEKFLRRERAKDFFLCTYFLSLLVFVLLFFIGRLFKFPLPFILSLIIIFSFGITLSLFVLFYPRNKLDKVAFLIDQVEGQKDKVINALQLGKEKGILFQRLIVKEGIKTLSSFSPQKLVNTFRRRFLIRTNISMSILTGVIFLFFSPLNNIPAPVSYKLEITPGNVKIEKGKDLLIEAIPQKEIPPFVKIKTGEAENFMEFSDSHFSYLFKNLEKPFKYQVSTLRFKSPFYRVEITEPLKIWQIKANISPPSYTGVKSFKLEGWEEKEVPEGSQVEFEVSVNQKILKAWIEGNKQPLTVKGRTIEGKVIIGKEPIRVKIEKARKEFTSFTLPWKGRSDSPPSIEIIIKPGKDMEGADKTLEITTLLRDEYGLEEAQLKAKKEGKEIIVQSLPLSGEKEKSITWEWNIEKLQLNEGDEIEYWVAARDNQPPEGQWAKSSSYHYLWKKAEQKENEEALLTLKEILQQEEAIYKDTLTAQNSLQGKGLELRQEKLRKQTLQLSETENIFYPFPVRRTLKQLAEQEMSEAVQLLSFRNWEEALEKEERIIGILKTLLQQGEWSIEKKEATIQKLAELAEQLSQIEEKGNEIVSEMKKESTDLSSIELKHSEWQKMIKDLRNEVNKLPPIIIPNSTVAEQVNEIYSDIQMAEELLSQKVVEMAVTRDQIGLDLAEKLSQDLEMWLPDTPDRLRWELEQPEEIPDVPMAELPDELEDLIGELLESEENLLSEAEDFTSSWADSLSSAGWAVMDGPISNFSAKGKTGNVLPNINEITGRSGEGRTGPTSGEMVQSEMRGLGGRKTPLRYTPDQIMEGAIKEQKETPAGGGTTLGGKLAGKGGGGLPGEAPYDYVEGLRKLEQESLEIMGMAKKVKWNLSSLGYPVGKIDESLKRMEEANALFKEKNMSGFLRKHREVIFDLSRAKKEVQGEIEWRKTIPSSLPMDYRIPLLQSLKEEFPPEYAEYLKDYFKRIVEEEK
ncbi:MAG: hypothetical protein GXO71_00275 [Caldiserica bacterium]|nr:hypothetical protein [Caldisericota bacterium]